MQKYYHASPKRFKIGTILSNPGVHKKNYNASIEGIYVTTSPYPHHTISHDFLKLNIYEVLPLTKIYKGIWGDFITDQVKVIKYIGNASNKSKTGLSSKSSDFVGGKTVLYHNKSKRKYCLTIYEHDFKDWYIRGNNKSRNIWSDDLNKIINYIKKHKVQYYTMYDNLKRKQLEPEDIQLNESKNEYNGVSVYLNPMNIKRYSNWSRGVIFKNGDFYIFKKSSGVATHNVGLRAMSELGMINADIIDDWWRRQPTDFLCVQRLEDTGEFYTSESYYIDIEIEASSFIKNAQQKAKSYNTELLFYPTQILNNSY